MTFSQSGQHLVLLTIRQYESKSYRMFTADTTLQKFTDRITGTIHSGKDNNFFFHSPYNNCQTNIPWNRLIWIQANPRIITVFITLKEVD